MPENLNSVPQKPSTWDMCSLEMIVNHNKKGTGNPCTNITNWSQRPLQIPWNGPIQQRSLDEAQRHACPTPLVGECGHTKVTKALKTKKVPWHWDEVHQKAFDDVKAVIARDVALVYPDYPKDFEIYTNASSRQMRAVIT